METEYSSPFAGAEVTTQTVDADAGRPGSSEWGVTTTGSTAAGSAEASVIDDYLTDSRFSRADLELAVRILSVVAAIGALYVTVERGSA